MMVLAVARHLLPVVLVLLRPQQPHQLHREETARRYRPILRKWERRSGGRPECVSSIWDASCSAATAVDAPIALGAAVRLVS